jgi:hypothetical protein
LASARSARAPPSRAAAGNIKGAFAPCQVSISLRAAVAQPVVAPDVPGVPGPPVNSNVRLLENRLVPRQVCIEMQERMRAVYVEQRHYVARAWMRRAERQRCITHEAGANSARSSQKCWSSGGKCWAPGASVKGSRFARQCCAWQSVNEAAERGNGASMKAVPLNALKPVGKFTGIGYCHISHSRGRLVRHSQHSAEGSSSSSVSMQQPNPSFNRTAPGVPVSAG